MKHLTVWTLAALALLIGPATSQLGPNGILPIGPGGGGSTSAKGIITACGASNNQLLFDSSGSCAGLATANSGVLVTSGAGAPSISSTLPTGLTVGTLNNYTLTAPATAATLTIANNKTLTVNNILTLAGTDSTTMTFPGASDTMAGLGTTQTFTAMQTISAANMGLLVKSSGLPTTVNVSQTVIGGENTGTPTLTADGQAWIYKSASGGLNLQGRGSSFDFTAVNQAGNSVFGVPSNSQHFQMASVLELTNSGDTGIARNAAGVVEINNTNAGTLRDLTLRNITATGSITTSSTTDATSISTGAMQNTGGMSVNKRVWMNGLTTSGSAQTNNICQSAGGELIADSVGCLVSSERFKTVLGDLEGGAVAKLMRLPLRRWRYNAEGIFQSESWTRERIGPTAEDVAAIDDRLVGYGSDGKVRTFSTDQLLALTIKAIQEQQIEIDELRRQAK